MLFGLCLKSASVRPFERRNHRFKCSDVAAINWLVGVIVIVWYLFRVLILALITIQIFSATACL